MTNEIKDRNFIANRGQFSNSSPAEKKLSAEKVVPLQLSENKNGKTLPLRLLDAMQMTQKCHKMALKNKNLLDAKELSEIKQFGNRRAKYEKIRLQQEFEQPVNTKKITPKK